MKRILLSLLLVMLVAGMVVEVKMSNGQKVSTGESALAGEQAEIDLIKKMEN